MLNRAQLLEIQQFSPEILFVEVLDVEHGPLRDHPVSGCGPMEEILVHARVVDFSKTSSDLKTGDLIRIQYDLETPPLAPEVVPIPLLEQGKRYPAFLYLAAEGTHYEPSAQEYSFQWVQG